MSRNRKKSKGFDLWKPKQKQNNLENGTIQQRKQLKWLNRLISQALSRFKWEGLPNDINIRFLEHELLKMGALAFTYDEHGKIYSILPFTNDSGKLDPYGEPTEIRVYSPFNGFNSPKIKKFGLIYDNLSYHPIMPVLEDYAHTLANIEMAMEVNMENQKTPFIVSGTEEQISSYKIALNSVTENKQVVFVTEDFNPEAFKVNITSAPYLLDKLQEHKNNVYNEALQFLGIDTISYQKKERKTNEEIQTEKETTLSARNSAIQARQNACDIINNLFGLSVKCNWVSDSEESGGL